MHVFLAVEKNRRSVFENNGRPRTNSDVRGQIRTIWNKLEQIRTNFALGDKFKMPRTNSADVSHIDDKFLGGKSFGLKKGKRTFS